MQQQVVRDAKLEDAPDIDIQKKNGMKRRRKRKRCPAAAEPEETPNTKGQKNPTTNQ